MVDYISISGRDKSETINRRLVEEAERGDLQPFTRGTKAYRGDPLCNFTLLGPWFPPFEWRVGSLLGLLQCENTK